jgi:peptidoglycan/LPS O-acetylase OafA/YrhL
VHSWATAFPQNVVLTFIAATISFYAVEQPIRKLRERRTTPVYDRTDQVPVEADELVSVE